MKPEEVKAALVRLGNRIRDARIRRGWSQDSVAEDAGMKRSRYGALEQGARKCGIDALVLGLHQYGIDLVESLSPVLKQDAQESGMVADDHILALAIEQLRSLYRSGAPETASILSLITTTAKSAPKQPRIRPSPAPSRGRRTARLQEAARKSKQAGS